MPPIGMTDDLKALRMSVYKDLQPSPHSRAWAYCKKSTCWLGLKLGKMLGKWLDIRPQGDVY